MNGRRIHLWSVRGNFDGVNDPWVSGVIILYIASSRTQFRSFRTVSGPSARFWIIRWPLEGGELCGPIYIKLHCLSTNSQFLKEKTYNQAYSHGYTPGLAHVVAHKSCPFFVKGEPLNQ